jgi:hypothetical protein
MNNIKRILTLNDLEKFLNDLEPYVKEHEDKNESHVFLKHDISFLKRYISHPSLLFWDFFIWGHLNEEDKYDSFLIFFNEKSGKFNEKLFSEYLWFSANKKNGYKLFKEALNLAKEMGFKYITISTIVNHPKHVKIKKFYEKIGFKKDSESYIMKL